jgi:hypothetical protein
MKLKSRGFAMDMLHDGASRQRPSILPKLALHGSAGLAAILCAGLVGHFMMGGDDPQPAPVAATAQIYEVPDIEHPDEAEALLEAQAPAAINPDANAAPKPVAAAPIPPKPVARPVVKAAERQCDGGECEPWETIVNKALAAGPTAQYRPEPIRAAAPRQVPTVDPYQTGSVGPAVDAMPQPIPGRNIPPEDVMPRYVEPQDTMPDNGPLYLQREGPTSIGGMAKSATTSAAATVVTQSSRMVDNLMRWGETAASSVGIAKD